MLLGITGCGTKKDDGKIKVEIGNWAAETADPAVIEKLDTDVAEFEKLPLERDLPILRNIIYEGIKMSGKKCKTGEKK